MAGRSGWQVAACAIGLTLLAVGCGRSGANPRPAPPPTTEAGPATTIAPPIFGALQAADQTGDGTRIVVARAELRGIAGYIVAHAESQGGPGEVVGHAAIAEGVSRDVVVPLDAAVPSGAYWVMLHRDGGAVGVFEWPGRDGPVRAPQGIRYTQKRVVLTVEP